MTERSRVCTYDNPSTMARECWQDGEIICHYSYTLLPPFATEPIPAEYFFFGANIGPWKVGQLVGDSPAIQTQFLDTGELNDQRTKE